MFPFRPPRRWRPNLQPTFRTLRPRACPPRSTRSQRGGSPGVRGRLGRGAGHHPHDARPRTPPSQAARAGRLHRCSCVDPHRRGGPADHRRAADRTGHHEPSLHQPDAVRPDATGRAARVCRERVCTGRMDPSRGRGHRTRLRSMVVDDLEPLGIHHPPRRPLGRITSLKVPAGTGRQDHGCSLGARAPHPRCNEPCPARDVPGRARGALRAPGGGACFSTPKPAASGDKTAARRLASPRGGLRLWAGTAAGLGAGVGGQRVRWAAVLSGLPDTQTTR